MIRNLIILIIILLLTPALWAQDTTCDSGDILWVKETVAADTGHTSGTTGAEYNNFATPFGIQRAFDQTCAGAIIRIVAGVNIYGPASTSWTGRDAANMQINVDTVDADASTATYIKVQGWVDETTACGTVGNRWTASCPVVLDFDRDGITGADGFNHGALGDGYLYQWIGTINTDTDGFDPSLGAAVHFSYVSVENATSGGIRTATAIGHIVNSFFRNVGTGGSAAAIISAASDMRAIGNVVVCSTGSPASGQNGINLTGDRVIIIGNVVRNCNVGLALNSDNHIVYRNTINTTTGDCVLNNGGSPTEGVYALNVFEACAGDAIEWDTGSARLLPEFVDNVYGQAGSQINTNASSHSLLDPADARNGNGVTFASLGCEFASASDETLNSDCAIPNVPPGAQLSSQGGLTPGAVYEAGGGGVSIMLQGVR